MAGFGILSIDFGYSLTADGRVTAARIATWEKLD
jgi:hypothetical protein